jgi:hypothetical protein
MYITLHALPIISQTIVAKSFLELSYCSRMDYFPVCSLVFDRLLADRKTLTSELKEMRLVGKLFDIKFRESVLAVVIRDDRRPDIDDWSYDSWLSMTWKRQLGRYPNIKDLHFNTDEMHSIKHCIKAVRDKAVPPSCNLSIIYSTFDVPTACLFYTELCCHSAGIMPDRQPGTRTTVFLDLRAQPLSDGTVSEYSRFEWDNALGWVLVGLNVQEHGRPPYRDEADGMNTPPQVIPGDSEFRDDSQVHLNTFALFFNITDVQTHSCR